MHDGLPVPTLTTEDCADGGMTCLANDTECQSRAAAAGETRYARHGAEGHYCAPALTRTSLSAFSWLLIIVALVVTAAVVGFGTLVWSLVRKRKTSPPDAGRFG